jgi:hypothetical protein
MTYSSFSTSVASSASDDTADTDYTVTVKNTGEFATQQTVMLREKEIGGFRGLT